MKENRNIKYDNIKGILILLVIFGHFLIDYHNFLSCFLLKLIYLFHMPFFAYISGIFSKKKDNRTGFYLFLYIVINIIYAIFCKIVLNSDINLIYPYYSTWYLLSLCYWKIIYKCINLKTKKAFLISVFIALIIGFIPFINNAFALSRTMAFFPFFILGAIQKDKAIKYSLLKKIISFIIIIISIILIFNNNINMSQLMMENYTSIKDLFLRIIILISAYSIINIFIKIVINKKIKCITKFGIYSLQIYIFHRFIVILLSKLFQNYLFNEYIILVFAILSFILCLFFSYKIFHKIIIFLSLIYKKILPNFQQSILTSFKQGDFLIFLIFIFCLSLPFLLIDNISKPKENLIYNEVNDKTTKKIKNSIKISYIGDLILLKKQIQYNQKNNLNNYDYIFEDTKDYLSNSDYAIGILEGPIAGENLGYTNSNFNDNKKLYFNFPNEFISSIKKSGIDLVSISNNHILDKGRIGLDNTIKNLKENNLDYVGGYLNKNDKVKNNIKIVNIKNLKIAVLAYTYGVNYHSENDLISNYAYTTSYLSDPESINFNKIKKIVKNDFQKAKKYNPDLIVVLPHMGTQFSHNTDYYQDTWNNLFSKYGADIVLGAHSHSVQPIDYLNNTLIINSPGNFINSYLENDGDLSSIVNIYINKKTRKIISTSIIPLVIEKENDMYKTNVIDKYKKSKVTKEKYTNLNVKNEIITNTMINTKINLDSSVNEYFYFKEGYKRLKNTTIEENNINVNSQLYKLFKKNKKIAFIGDSITQGSKNGGYGYYEPIINYFNSIGYKKQVCLIAKSGATTTTINKILKKTSCSSSLYVIALGTNNIRYKNEKNRTPKRYINSLNSIINKINNKEKHEIIIISPFMSLDDDIFYLNSKEKKQMYEEYDKILKEYSKKNNFYYININNNLEKLFTNNSVAENYLIDYIHPNNHSGIKLYSELLLQ